MRKVLIAAILFLNLLPLFSQKGAPLLTHFPGFEPDLQNWAICQDDNNIMYFANRKGVLAFDGINIRRERVPVIPFAMEYIPGTDRIYIGGDNDYGYLEKNDLGQFFYTSLSGDSASIGLISGIVWYDSDVWFYGEESVSRHNIATDKLELRSKPEKGSSFSGITVFQSEPYINVTGKGLCRVENGVLVPLETGYLLGKVEVLFSLPYSRKLSLLGLSNGKLTLFDGSRFYDFLVKDNGYLAENSLSGGLAIGDSLYAFSTLGGGAVLVDRKSGTVRHILNTANDLPDDEVFAMVFDRSGGLWLSHQAGLSRVNLNLPLENFSIFPGLTGNLSTSLWHNDELYAATSDGLFALVRDENVSEFDVLVQDTSFTVNPPVIEKPLQPAMNIPVRKGVLSRIFGGKEPETPAMVPSAVQSVDTVKGVARQVSTFSWKRVRRLNSVSYVFKKIDGINEKCRQLVPTRNGILVATTRGLFKISNRKAGLIVKDRYINHISQQGADGKYYVGTNDGFFSVRLSGNSFVAEYPDVSFSAPVYSIVRGDSNVVWLGTGNKCYKYESSEGSRKETITSFTAGNEFPQIYWVDIINDTVKLFLESGIYWLNPEKSEFVEEHHDESTGRDESRYNTSLLGQSWLIHDDNYRYLKNSSKLTSKETSILKIFENIISIDLSDDYIWIVDGRNKLYRFDRNSEMKVNPENEIIVTSVYNDNQRFSISDVIINGFDKSISFEVIAPGYIKQNSTYYQYIIEGKMPEWSKWSLQTEYTLPFFNDPGRYTLRVRARDIWDNVGEPVSISFAITAPFTQTTLFYVLVGISALLIIVIFFVFREKILQKEKRVLEIKVRERTSEIESQKNLITSSILYASRIQVALLPADDHFRNIFDEYFIFFRPRDIVSGDFYWIGEDDKNIYVTVADCTGHGVPGAFMSTLGITTLNEIISNSGDVNAANVLNRLRDKIKTALHQTGKDGEATDGMDMAFCILNKERNKLQYAGAYNPLFLFRHGEFGELKGDRMPIGIHYGEKDKFTNWEVEVGSGDSVYIFSDGLADQFGGTHGSKFKISNLKKLLKDIYFLPMEEQLKIIRSEFEKWKGTHDQVDDVTIIGFRI